MIEFEDPLYPSMLHDIRVFFVGSRIQKYLLTGGGLIVCEVQLVAYTPEPAKVVAAAAKLCYSASPAVDLFRGLD